MSYSYDQVGNRLSATVNGTLTSYSYGPYNKLLSADSTTYSYDNNGNMISKTSGPNPWTYAYDYQNRLKQVKVNGILVFQALYDGDGRRVQTVAGTDTTIYHYQAGSWDPIYVKGLTSGTITDVLFARSLRIGKVRGGISYFYHLDRLGSVRLVTKSGNIQTFSAKYLPYGTSYATSGSELFKYTGKQLDVSTGLYYYGYRHYDSKSGRFSTLDTHRPDYLNPQSLNRYSYALNDPNRYLDPDGRMFYDTDDAGNAMAGGIEAFSKSAPDTRMPDPARLGGRNLKLLMILAGLPYGIYGQSTPTSTSTQGTATTTTRTTTPPDYVVGTGVNTTNSATGQNFAAFAQNYAAKTFLLGAVGFEWTIISTTWEVQLAAGPVGIAGLAIELVIFGVTIYAWEQFASGQATLSP